MPHVVHVFFFIFMFFYVDVVHALVDDHVVHASCCS
jgi:hypothetical protein